MKAVLVSGLWESEAERGSRNTCLHAFPQLLALGWGVETCAVEGKPGSEVCRNVFVHRP